MRHDADAGRIFVDKDVIRALVGAFGEDVLARVTVVGERERQQPRHDGRLKPGGQRCVEKLVIDEVRRPGLQASMGELFPSRTRSRGDLEKACAVISRAAGGDRRHHGTAPATAAKKRTLSRIRRSSSSLMKFGK